MKEFFMGLLNFLFRKQDPDRIVRQNYQERILDRYKKKKQYTLVFPNFQKIIKRLY